jgi:hypothetical protein
VAQDVLIATGMRLHHLTRYVGLISIAGVALTLCDSAARAQTTETITATAQVTFASGANASAPFTIVIDRFATDADRDALVRAVKTDGSEAGRRLLAKHADAGTVQLGTRTAAVKYAFVRTVGDGRLITALTIEPLVFLGAGQPQAKPTSGYDIGVVMIEVPSTGIGQGELVPAARIRIDEHDSVVTEAYTGVDVVRLSNVAKK